jgi:hypothetical protein
MSSDRFFDTKTSASQARAAPPSRSSCTLQWRSDRARLAGWGYIERRHCVPGRETDARAGEHDASAHDAEKNFRLRIQALTSVIRLIRLADNIRPPQPNPYRISHGRHCTTHTGTGTSGLSRNRSDAKPRLSRRFLLRPCISASTRGQASAPPRFAPPSSSSRRARPDLSPRFCFRSPPPSRATCAR